MFSKGIQETAKKIHEYDLSWNYKKTQKMFALLYTFSFVKWVLQGEEKKFMKMT